MRLYGDWEKAKRIFSKAKDRARKGYGPREQALLKLGNAIKQRVREHILAQDLGWVPLSNATIARKGGGVIYFDTGTYIRNIKVTLRKGKHGVGSTTLMVGPYGTHKPSGLPMRTLAAILEYGTSAKSGGRRVKIPARPLWRPMVKEVQSMSEFDRLVDTLLSLKDD